ncbi:TPR-like protein [Melanogaster broomeanus]|nr:TPR-like protein [Melanogaster broomeanus]
MAKFTSCQARGAHLDLDEPIHLYQEVLDLRPPGHPDHASTLINLTIALLSRFRGRGCITVADADEAEELLRRSLDICPPHSHEYRAAFLVKAFSLHRRGDEMPSSYNLLQAASGGWRLPYSVNELAGLLRECHKRDHPQLLDELIEQHRDSMKFFVTEGQEWVVLEVNFIAALHNLANALSRRFEQRGDGKDLDEAIQHHRTALQLRPEGHPDCSASLINLANQGDGKDLDEAIQHHITALQLMPEGDPLCSASLNNLATALSRQFEQQGDGKDLDKAIQHHRTALQLLPEGHPDCSASLNNLATALSTRFEQQGDGKDLDEAIQHHRTALQLRPEGHPDHSASLNNLATALSTRFEQQGDGKDLEEAIQHHRTALQLRPEGHPLRSGSLNNLATALSRRFQQQGDGKDLDEAIQHHRTALQLRPEGHPLRSPSLNNLATALSRRFEQRGDGKDLDQAIQHHRTALQFLPEGHPLHSGSLNNLATALSRRFEQRGDGKDLDQAIQHHRTALQLLPEGHPLRSGSLNNLATALSRRFQQQGDGKDLDQAIQHHRTALQFLPEGHPLRSGSLNNLATALSRRFQQQGDGKDLDEAIQHHRTALQLMPEGHPLRSGSLNNLATALSRQFEQQGDGKDLDEAIQHHRTALQLRPEGHPLRSPSLNNLATALIDLEDGMHHYKLAAQFPSASPLERLRCSLTWVRVAEEHIHASALDAYTQSLHLLDSHIRMHFPQDLAVNAASCALRQGNICHAIELLEQGRALHWTQLARFRSTLDEFASGDTRAAMLVNQFQHLSAMLNRPADVSAEEDYSITATETKVQQYRNLLEQWNKIVEEIRTLEGFSQFLLPPLFGEIQEAACKGPVIVLIASKFSCDAIIVLHTQSPIHIQLQITWKEMSNLVGKHLQNIHNSYGPDHNIFVETMGRIWKIVVFPVVCELKKQLKKNSRIWWCPTSLFTALPIHTAGEYQQDGSVLSKLFISSYTPSLSALIKAQKGLKMTSEDVKFVAIGQASPHSDMLLQPLSESTRQEALQSLQDHQWFHLSCHGKQVLKEPFKSCFAMHDAPLSLLDIINANISGHEFAFLSACETAMGDLSAADEVIHLAAGLQFMGVKSVIGTLWSVGDKLAYELVLAYYKEFCKNGTMDCTMAAGALHKAVALLAKKNVPLVERAMFVHIGI